MVILKKAWTIEIHLVRQIKINIKKENRMKIKPMLKGFIGAAVASFLVIGLNATMNNPAMSKSVEKNHEQTLSYELQPMTLVEVENVKPFVKQQGEEALNERKADAESVRSNLQVLNSVRSIRENAFKESSPTLSNKPTL